MRTKNLALVWFGKWRNTNIVHVTMSPHLEELGGLGTKRRRSSALHLLPNDEVWIPTVDGGLVLAHLGGVARQPALNGND